MGRLNPVPPQADATNRYPEAVEWAYMLLRVAAGAMLIPHVWPKLMAGPSAIAANVMARRGLEPALFFAYAAIVFEVAGIVLITLGLFTRIMALLLVIEFVFIVYVHFASGGWMASTQGAEGLSFHSCGSWYGSSSLCAEEDRTHSMPR